MKFTKSQKEPKKSPEEEYASQISTLTENELRDLHKDLKIDHYGNSTAAVINTASGVGLLSMRSTTRRYKTECMQIEAIEARMKENGWTPHPHRYRDAVPIALGVAAGTTAGMTFGLINVEKNAKRTRDYVKKKDLFNTKELVQTDKVLGTNETEGVEVVKEVEPAEITVERTQTPSTTITESVTTQHTILRKPLPNTAATETQVKTSQTQSLSIETTNATSIPTAEPTITKTPPSPTLSPPTEESQTPEPTPPKKEKGGFFKPISAMNKKMLSFTSKKEKADSKETTISIVEIACDDEGPEDDTGAAGGQGIVERLDSLAVSAFEAGKCAV